MGEYDFTDNLVTLSRFRDSNEATLVRARLEAVGIEASLESEESAPSTGNWASENHSVELLVRQGDLRHARDILADMQPQVAEHDDDDLDDYDADDWSGEDWADADEDYEDYSEEPTETPPLVRAWRAALIGGLLLPCLLLNIYSMWLIFRHQLWLPQQGEKKVNWRYPAALLLNVVGVAFFWLIVRW